MDLPRRFEPLERLGQGGGGEVWAVRARHGGTRLALKVLASGYGPAEVDALIREAVALSGLEGLGLPRVLEFGRLSDGRPYMVRELVEGRSLEKLIESDTSGAELLESVARAADLLTEIHRAELLHGDVKPANVIVRSDGKVSLVDLGLAAPWLEGGAIPEGLTPHYAAPELLRGRPLTSRSEVFSLGVIVRELVAHRGEELGERRAAVSEVAERATREAPAARYPSADEFASALRHAADLPAPELFVSRDHWPVEGIDRAAGALLAAVERLQEGQVLHVSGPPESGRSTLLQRVAWTLGMKAVPLVWLDEEMMREPADALAELDSLPAGVPWILVDAPDAADEIADCLAARLNELQPVARIVFTGGLELPVSAGFDVPPLDTAEAVRLLRRAIPSLTDVMVQRVIEATGGRPGQLRGVVAAAGSEPLVSAADLERVLARHEGLSLPPESPVAAAEFYLEHGRYAHARTALDLLDPGGDARAAWLEARWQLAAGTAERALELTTKAAALNPGDELGRQIGVCRARALLGVGAYREALEQTADAEALPAPLRAEALAYRGLSQSLLGERSAGVETIQAALAVAPTARLRALVGSSLATALWRVDRLEEAREAYEGAILAAEEAGDAGMLSSAQINLAGLLKTQGDLAAAVAMLEVAVDSARRSGRRSTLHQALLNLANADLYLGRLERARSSIEAVASSDALPAVSAAQLAGLRADLAACTEPPEVALCAYDDCEARWLDLGRRRDAAEAALEAVLVGARAESPDVVQLRHRFERAQNLIEGGDAHRALAALAEARLAFVSGDDAHAETACEKARGLAGEGGQREVIWRALELESELRARTGQLTRSRRALEEALEVLEDISARLPRDLREVYWNDPRRRGVRQAAELSLGRGMTELARRSEMTIGGGIDLRPLRPEFASATNGVAAVSRMTQTPLEQRLARILAINSDLAGEMDLERLAQRIVAHGAELLGAERGFLLMAEDEGAVSVRASRGTSESQHVFSKSVAQRVLRTGEPLVSVDVARDGRLRSVESVHQMSVTAIACVPVHAPTGSTIGALYLESRGAPGARFADELPTLRALADQAAIALENARLLSEVQARTSELELSNEKLAEAQERLRELLGARTARLKEARRELRSTKKALEAHYTYEGLVGTSAPMRRVYALIERVKETTVPILITGESGTGKEVVARAIHQGSPRAPKSMLAINCGAVPEQILESELFGHVRGAFTGADRERKGLFREAEGGTLFLDEIGETPQKMQAGLLRVLQEGKVRPVGGRAEEPVDVRLVFATNRDLGELVERGNFREDLFYRIQVVEIALPPLRERVDDIPQLVDHFFQRFATRFGTEKKYLSRAALRALMQYEWPGNVRQLENVLLNAWVLSEGEEIEIDELELPTPSGRVRARTQPPPSPEGGARAARGVERVVAHESKRQTLSQHRRDEKQAILDALEASNWNRVQAAAHLGIPRRTFYRRLRQYGIQ